VRRAHLARRLSDLGHEVRLMPAQYVRPFVKTNKHDQADPRVRLCRPEGRQAIGEAVQRPQKRFVPVRSQARPAGAASGA
jgi:transposase